MTETEFLLHLVRATKNETKKDKTGETRKKALSVGGKTIMNLEEAIQHLSESLNDKSHNWGCKECRQEHEQLLSFLLELKKRRNAAKVSVEDALRDKTDIKITFRGGGEIVIPDEQWDDYRYDGKFFTVIKNGADIAMYNAKEVFSLVLTNSGK